MQFKYKPDIWYSNKHIYPLLATSSKNSILIMRKFLITVIALHFLGFAFGQVSGYKFGEGLKITTKNSAFDVKLSGRVQTLFTSQRTLVDDADWEQEILIRRARLKGSGHLFSPKLSYKVEFGLSKKDRSPKFDHFSTAKVPVFILDAVLKYKVNKNLEIWAGQTKLPGNRERLVSSQALQFVDRSLVNSIFNLDREIGLQLRSKFEIGDNMVLKPSASISMGEARNALFSNLGGSHYAGKLEFLPFGDFEKGAYFESDLKRENTPKVLLAMTYSYNDNAMRQKATGGYLVDEDGNYLQNDLGTFLASATFKYKGISVASEYAHKTVLNSMSDDGRVDLLDENNNSYLTGAGFNLQAAYLFKSNSEIATRITKVTPDTVVSFDGLTEYTLGMSQYFNGHKLKVQGDISYSDFDGTADNKLRYRLQVEVGF